MKNPLPLVITMGVITASSLFGQIDTSQYRIAMSHDGNAHDADDIGALPMSMAIVAEAGLAGRVVHIEHSNHWWSNHDQQISGQPQKMIDSANGAASRWGYSSSIIYNCRNNLSGARTNLKNAINASTSSNRLYIGAEGPMDTVHDAIVASNQAARQHVTVVSHSTWNNNHSDAPSHDNWADVQNTGVRTTKIVDQNSSDGDNDFNTPNAKWFFLRDAAQEKYRWLYSRDFESSFDVSDAGIYWYIITGRGDQRGGWPEVKALFGL